MHCGSKVVCPWPLAIKFPCHPQHRWRPPYSTYVPLPWSSSYLRAYLPSYLPTDQARPNAGCHRGIPCGSRLGILDAELGQIGTLGILQCQVRQIHHSLTVITCLPIGSFGHPLSPHFASSLCMECHRGMPLSKRYATHNLYSNLTLGHQSLGFFRPVLEA